MRDEVFGMVRCGGDGDVAMTFYNHFHVPGYSRSG